MKRSFPFLSFVLTFFSPFIDLFLSTGVRNGADTVLIQYITQWVQRNERPATIMIISCDQDFYRYLLGYRQTGYTIIGAARGVRSLAWMQQLAAACYEWDALANGEYDLQRQRQVTRAVGTRP